MNISETKELIRDKMLSLIRDADFPPYTKSEVKGWIASPEVHEALTILSEWLERDASLLDFSVQERMNRLALHPAVSMTLAVLDRCSQERGDPSLNLLSLLEGKAHDRFAGSLAYVMATHFRLKPPAHSNPSWRFFQESFTYFIIERVLPVLNRESGWKNLTMSGDRR